jgi:chitinase
MRPLLLSILSLLLVFPTILLNVVSAAPSNNAVAVSWYPGWRGSDYPPDKIHWSGYTQVNYAVAVTTANPAVISLDPSDQQLLPKFVSTAHKNHVAAGLTIGGWTGSRYFSSAVSTPSSRTAFVNAVLGLAKTYKLDAIDFDWEYPNGAGIGCNQKSPSDTANFLLFLQNLRSTAAGKKLTISAAVAITPFLGPGGTPSSDVSGFSTVLDYITIMNYDVWGSWSTGGVGPNAPLNDTCSTKKEGSAVSAVQAWTAAKFPSNKIVLGVASYGHSYFVKKSDALDASGKLKPYPPFDASQQPHGDSWDAPAGTDVCGNPTPIGGIFNFWGLISGGFLTQAGTPAPGIHYRFDSCSQTPYVYNDKSQVMVAYDDARSFAAKGQFINHSKLKGFAMWTTTGDSNNILLNSIRTAMHL